jgi:hypothetical protein
MVARWFSVENINTKGCGCRFTTKFSLRNTALTYHQSIPMGFAYLFALFCISWDIETHLRRVLLLCLRYCDLLLPRLLFFLQSPPSIPLSHCVQNTSHGN